MRELGHDASVAWHSGYRLCLHHLRGFVYYDDRSGTRNRIGSFCLDDPQQGAVVPLPIFPIQESRR